MPRFISVFQTFLSCNTLCKLNQYLAAPLTVSRQPCLPQHPGSEPLVYMNLMKNDPLLFSSYQFFILSSFSKAYFFSLSSVILLFFSFLVVSVQSFNDTCDQFEFFNFASRCQFHQHFNTAFLIQKLYVQLFVLLAYVCTFDKKVLGKKLIKHVGEIDYKSLT